MWPLRCLPVTETLDTANEIKSIRFKIDSIEATLQLILWKDAPVLVDMILELFRRDSILPHIYDALDGTRSQKQVVEFLQTNSTRCSEPTVSRRIQVLDETGLIEKVKVTKDGTIWAKKHSVERGLRLTKELRKAALLG